MRSLIMVSPLIRKLILHLFGQVIPQNIVCKIPNLRVTLPCGLFRNISIQVVHLLVEKPVEFFHQEMHYLDRETAEKTARECYPEIRDFAYDILWNDLPKEVQEQLMDEEESL